MYVERRKLGILAYCPMCSPVVDAYKMLIAATKHNGYNKTYKEETMLKIGLSQYYYNFLLVLIIKFSTLAKQYTYNCISHLQVERSCVF